MENYLSELLKEVAVGVIPEKDSSEMSVKEILSAMLQAKKG